MILCGEAVLWPLGNEQPSGLKDARSTPTSSRGDYRWCQKLRTIPGGVRSPPGDLVRSGLHSSCVCEGGHTVARGAVQGMSGQGPWEGTCELAVLATDRGRGPVCSPVLKLGHLANGLTQPCPSRCWRLVARKEGFGFGNGAARLLFLAANGQQVQQPCKEPQVHGWKTTSVVTSGLYPSCSGFWRPFL